MMANRWRLPVALLALALYLAIVFWDAWVPHAFTGLMASLVNGISPRLLVGAIFLVALALAMRWGDLGLNGPRPWRNLRVLLPSLLYLVVFLALALYLGLPPARAALFVGLNTFLAGFAEEMMFRGILFRALLQRVRLWVAIWLTSLTFGMVHLLNALTTGDLGMAAVQAIAAFMTGTFLLAIVLRTGSLWPSILYHAAWDFSIGLIAAGHPPPAAAAVESHTAAISLVPVLLVLPNFLYALFLLRRRAMAPVAA
jgi:membrane protease YdiL (CAAX protease family)